jgi:hypothetical protein
MRKNKFIQSLRPLALSILKFSADVSPKEDQIHIFSHYCPVKEF